MIKTTNTANQVEALASKISRDIVARGLKPGSRYFTAQEVGAFHDISTITAHRAMQKLAADGFLVRRRKGGTFVGGNAANLSLGEMTELKVIHVLMPLTYCYLTEVDGRMFVEAINAVLPRAAVQIHYVPDDRPFSYVESVTPQLTAADGSVGVILIRSSEQIQRYVEAEGINAVVFGGIYPGIKKLSWVDVDQAQTGRLIAQCALDSSFKKFVLLMSNHWQPGDNIMFEAVRDVFGSAGLDLSAFSQWSLPARDEFVREEIKRLIKGSDSPLMFLCRSDFYADAVIDAMSSMGLFYGQDVGVVSGAHLRSCSKKNYSYIIPTVPLKAQIGELVKLLKANLLQQQDVEHHVIPVELWKPGK